MLRHIKWRLHPKKKDLKNKKVKMARTALSWDQGPSGGIHLLVAAMGLLLLVLVPKTEFLLLVEKSGSGGFDMELPGTNQLCTWGQNMDFRSPPPAVHGRSSQSFAGREILFLSSTFKIITPTTYIYGVFNKYDKFIISLQYTELMMK
jgi:hypothetical protein